jgi:hypothetical protein
MTFDDLLATFGSGFALDRVDELRVAAVGISTNKAQRKKLAAGLKDACSRGRVGRVANLALIGLLTDQEYWLDWIRRSPTLRPSAYDLEVTTPQKLLPIFRQIAEKLALPSDFTLFLGHVEWLIVLASGARSRRLTLIKLMAKDKLLVKSCLVTVDLLFIGRTESLTAVNVELLPEDAAAALSYLIFLVRKRFGLSSILLDGIDSKKIREGHYLSVLEETQKITNYFTWELLVFHFGYSCTLSEDHSRILIEAPTTEFAKALRVGFIRQEVQNQAFLLKAEKSITSLTDVAAKFAAFMEKQQLIRRKSSPDRWIFAIPVIPILTEYFSQEALFREEYAGLTLLCYDLLSSIQEVISFEIDGMLLMNLIKAQRLMYVIHRVQVEKLKQVWKTDTDAAIQSVAAVYEDESLLNFLGYSVPPEQAKKILAILEWKPETKSYLDIMYQPVVRAAGNRILIAPNLFSITNLPRNVLQLTQKRFGEKGDGLLAQRLKEELIKEGFLAWDDVGYRYGGTEGDCDVVAVKGGYLFVFECKNSLHPCSTAELRTSFDYLVKAKTQLEKFSGLWADAGFRQYFAKRLSANLSSIGTLTTAAVTGNRMFSGLQLGACKVLGFHELVNFIRDARVVILDQEFIGRDDGPLEPEQLAKFVTDAPWDQRMLDALRRKDQITQYGEIKVCVEDYSLKMIDLAAEWGVELSDELKDLLSGAPSVSPPEG